MVRMPDKEELRGYGKLWPGMEILATKWIGLNGTAYLAKAYKRQLRKHFPTPFVNQAAALSVEAVSIPAVMVVAEAQEEAKSSGKTSLKDVAIYEACEGGIYAALWRMAEESGVGLEIQLRQIPIRQETVEVCEFLDINPYQLLSGGCVLVGTYHAEELLRRFEKKEIPAVRIGCATDGNDRVLIDNGQVRYLERPQPDSFIRGMTGLMQTLYNMEGEFAGCERKF